MDYTELADRCVKVGILRVDRPTEPMTNPRDFYYLGHIKLGDDVNRVCHDGRVVLAAMIECQKREWFVELGTKTATVFTPHGPFQSHDWHDYELEAPIAILTACLDALEGKDD